MRAPSPPDESLVQVDQQDRRLSPTTSSADMGERMRQIDSTAPRYAGLLASLFEMPLSPELSPDIVCEELCSPARIGHEGETGLQLPFCSAPPKS